MQTSFLDPGMLCHELSLQFALRIDDGSGGFAENWSELATVFARIEPAGAKSLFAAGQRLEQATHNITIRFRDDVTSGMRFEKSGRTFLILNVTDPDETGRYLICITREDAR
ncbi:MAG: phage head closure protein [Rhizobiaceae bacterium]